MDKPGLYIHIPFCEKKCDYCAFVSCVVSPYEKDKYLDYLDKEISLYKDSIISSSIDTIYIGGGTPSCLSTDQLEKLLKSIEKLKLQPVEYTIEVNPSSFCQDKIDTLKKHNVNRISIGVQSLNDSLLRNVGRLHNSTQAKKVIKLAVDNNFRVSVDAIIGLDGQINNDIISFVNEVDKFKVNHISCYALSIEENTPLEERVKNGTYVPHSEDGERDLYDLLLQEVINKGYERYEVSSFSRNHEESRHNLKYWKGATYYGMGIAAHSLIGNKRYVNPSDFENYYLKLDKNELPRIELETLSRDDLMYERIILSLRMAQGLNIEQFNEEFDVDFDIKYRKVLKKIENYVDYDKKKLKIRDDYFYIMNQILVEFINCM